MPVQNLMKLDEGLIEAPFHVRRRAGRRLRESLKMPLAQRAQMRFHRRQNSATLQGQTRHAKQVVGNSTHGGNDNDRCAVLIAHDRFAA